MVVVVVVVVVVSSQVRPSTLVPTWKYGAGHESTQAPFRR